MRVTSSGPRFDLDPSFSTARRGEKFAESTEAFEPAYAPERLHHRLSIRMVADYLAGSALTTQEIARADARSSDVVNTHVRVVVEPQAITRNQNSFLATVTLGRTTVKKPFELRPAPRRGAVADMFGGGDEPAKPVLARLAVDIVSTAPGSADAHYRRVILDRLDGDAASPRIATDGENDDRMRTLLVQVWDGALAVGAMHPLQLLRHELETMTTQQTMMEQALATRYLGKPFTASQIAPPQYPRRLAQFFFYDSVEHHLMLRTEAPDVRIFHERPQLAFARHGVVVDDWSQPFSSRRFQESIDLVNLPYGFVGKAEKTRPLRLKTGVADTSLERSFSREGSDFNTLPLLAAAIQQKVAVKSVAPDQHGSIRELPIPQALKKVMLDELAQGRTLVVPAGLVTLNGVRTFGWWSIDPETGVPLGQMDLGAGQGAAESAKLTEATGTMSHTIGKLYGGCMGCFFAAAADALYDTGQQTVSAIPGTATIKTGENLGECLAHKWCEAVIEYAFLSANVASFHHREMYQEVLWFFLHLFGPFAVSTFSCH